MLPAPVYTRTRPSRNRLGLRIYPHARPRDLRYLGLWEHIKITLLARSKVTNLAAVGLGFLFALSVCLNMYYLLERKEVERDVRVRMIPQSFLAYSHNSSVSGTRVSDKFVNQDVPPTSLNATHLIIVPGHAIWTGSRFEDVYREENWILEPYQKGNDGRSIRAWVDQIKRGVELALSDPESLLVFSGGHTRRSTPSSESSSYYHLAQALSLFPPSFSRATTESFALDSYQNLIFSIARFREVTGGYPKRITVIGYGMKKRRFEELHRRAVGWRKEDFKYIGIDEVGDTSAQYEGELQNGFTPFATDLYGCHSFLQQKRLKRNPSRRFHPYHVSAPEMARLLNWCPGNEYDERSWGTLFNDQLPWI